MGQTKVKDKSIKPVHAWEYNEGLYKTREDAERAFYASLIEEIFPYESGYGYSAGSIAKKIDQLKKIFDTVPEVKAWA